MKKDEIVETTLTNNDVRGIQSLAALSDNSFAMGTSKGDLAVWNPQAGSWTRQDLATGIGNIKVAAHSDNMIIAYTLDGTPKIYIYMKESGIWSLDKTIE